MITERPILFSAPMVRAILDGTKTQTRRIMKPQPELQIMPSGKEREALEIIGPQFDPNGWTWKGCRYLPWPTSSAVLAQCPYGAPSYEPTRLWVRETFSETECDGGPCVVYKADGASWYVGATGDKRDGTWKQMLLAPTIEPPYEDFRFKPSIHMPRWASRITLEVESVRVERLNDCSITDALAEGIVTDDEWPVDPRDSYRSLWESINGPGSWEANPWVWVITFKRIAQ